MGMLVWSLASLGGLRIWHCTSCGVGHRHGLDPKLLWPWRRLAAVAPIWPPTLELPCAKGAALKNKTKQSLVFTLLTVSSYPLWFFSARVCYISYWFVTVFYIFKKLALPYIVFKALLRCNSQTLHFTYFFFGHPNGIWKFLGQRSNLWSHQWQHQIFNPLPFHLFKVYNSMGFSIFTGLYHNHYSLILERFYSPKETLYLYSHLPSTLTSSSHPAPGNH